MSSPDDAPQDQLPPGDGPPGDGPDPAAAHAEAAGALRAPLVAWWVGASTEDPPGPAQLERLGRGLPFAAAAAWARRAAGPPPTLAQLGPRGPAGASPASAPADRALAARALLLGLRLGPAAEAAAGALGVHLGLGRADLAHLRVLLQASAGPAPACPYAEFAAPPAFVTAALGPPRPRRRRAAALSPTRVRHPEDVAATEALGRLLPFDEAARWVSGAWPERLLQLMNLAGRVQVGPRQLPDLHALYLGVAARLGVDPAPPLFLQPGGIQASTAGVERPFVLVSELTVSLLSPPELEFVLGHELGHVRFDHVLHLTLAQLLRAPGALLAEIPLVGPALRHGAELALFDWQRKAELSCDRAGLLACQDLDAGLRVLMRLSGAPHGMVHRMDPEVWLEQHAALEGQQSALLGRLGYALSTVTRTHPWAVVRARRLADWARGGELDALLADCPVEPPDPWAPTAGPACPACGAPRAPEDRFCTACGAPLGDDP